MPNITKDYESFMQLSLDAIIKNAWQLYKKGFNRNIAASLINSIIFILVLLGMSKYFEAAMTSPDPQFSGHDALLMLFYFLVIIVVQATTHAFILNNCNNLYQQKQYTNFQLLYLSLQKLGPMFLGTFLYSLLFLIGFRLFVFPSILVATAFILFAPLILFENHRTLSAFSESFKRVKDVFMLIFSVAALNTFLQFSVKFIGGLIGQHNLIYSVIVDVILTAFVTPFVLSTTFATYQTLTYFKNKRGSSSTNGTQHDQD